MSQTNKIPERIKEFIDEHHVLTIASSNGVDLWCANAFYVFDDDKNELIITSDEATRHIRLTEYTDKVDNSPIIAGAIVLETETIGKIRGVQFRAKLIKGDDLLSKSRVLYLKRFPYAVLKGGDLWRLKLVEIKFTDNRLGFGKKINLVIDDNENWTTPL